MDIFDDPIKLLVEFRQMGKETPDEMLSFMHNRMARLSSAFKNRFDGPAFAQTIIAKTQPLLTNENQALPYISSIPITDVLLFGFKRLQELNSEENSQALKCLREQMIAISERGDLAMMPSSICATRLGDGSETVFVPTYGELVLADLVLTTKDSPKSHMHQAKWLAAKLDKVNPDYGSNSIPLAITALQLAKGSVAEIDFMGKTAQQSACKYMLQNDIMKMDEAVAINTIDSAVSCGVDLASVKVRQTLALNDYFKNTGNNVLYDKLHGEINRQAMTAIIAEEASNITNDYNPSAYFDI